MSYLLFVLSIDENTIPAKNLDLDIQIAIQEDEKDFNYNDLSMEEISHKKIPFINCNRKVFCGSNNSDSVNLLKSTDNSIRKEIFDVYDEILSKLDFVAISIQILVFNDYNLKDMQAIFRKKLGKVCKSPASAEKLNEKFENIITCIVMHHLNMLKFHTHDFLLELENFLTGILKTDLFELLFVLKPSVFFNNHFAEKDLNVEEFKQFMERIYYIYVRVIIFIYGMNHGSLTKKEDGFYDFSSYNLKNYILLKWMIEVERIYVIDCTKKFERFYHILVYSINANEVLIEEVAIMIQKTMNA